MKETADSIPSSGTNASTNWESIQVAYIASGNPEEDRRLAVLARENGQVVFLKDLPEESDILFQNTLQPEFKSAVRHK